MLHDQATSPPSCRRSPYRGLIDRFPILFSSVAHGSAMTSPEKAKPIPAP
jgi:hypothetical protein